MSVPKMEIWSCGGGTQSGAIAALIGDGTLPPPYISFMVDTGYEKSGTWPFVDEFIRPQLARAGCNLDIVSAKNYATVGLFSTKGKVLIPGFTDVNATVGKLDPFCSNEWKQRVGLRWLREKPVPPCRIWIGISVDEIRRVRLPTVGWVTNFYPLVFGKEDAATPNMKTRMTRAACVDRVRLAGWKGPIPHSACKICPNMSDSEWLEMKINWPDDFSEACRVEKDMQAVDPHFWLHPSCQPLETVDFAAPPTTQTSMFAERGCTGGCFT